MEPGAEAPGDHRLDGVHSVAVVGAAMEPGAEAPGDCYRRNPALSRRNAGRIERSQ